MMCATLVKDDLHGLNFIGKYNPDREYRTGDVVLTNDATTLVRVDDNWEAISHTYWAIDSCAPYASAQPRVLKSHCPHCGGPLNHNHKFDDAHVICEYCNSTVYRYTE